MATPVEILINAQNRAGAAFGQLDGQLAQVDQHSAKYTRTTAEMGRASGAAATAERDLANALDKVTTSGKAAGGQSEFVAQVMESMRRKAEALDSAVGKTTQAIDTSGRASTQAASGMQILAAGFGAIAATGAVQSLFGFAKEAVDFGGKLSALSEKTHISYEGLQRLSAGAEQSESSIDALAKGAVQLSKRLAEGKDSTAAALERLGLTFQDLRGLSPERQLELVSDRFSTVAKEADHATIATGLFGASGQELIPALAANLKKAGDEAKDLGLILSNEDVAALASLDAAVDRWSKQAQIEIAHVVAAFGDMDLAIQEVIDSQGLLLRGAIDYAHFIRNAASAGFSPLTGGPDVPNPLALPSSKLGKPNVGGDRFLPGDAKGAEAELGRRLKAQRDLAKASKDAATEIEKEDAARLKILQGQRKGYEELRKVTLSMFPEHLEFLKQEKKELAAGTSELLGRIQAQNHVRLARLATVKDATDLRGKVVGREAVLATLNPDEARGKNASSAAVGQIPGLSDLFSGSNLATLITSSIQGGGGLSGITSGLGAAAAGSLAKNVFGLAADSFLGTLLPGLGAALGPLLSKGLSALGGVFTGGEEARSVNPERDKFFAGFGGRGTGEGSGFATVAARLTEATGEAGGGQLFKDLVSASTMKDYEAALKAVTAALDKAKDSTTELANETERLGGLTAEEFDSLAAAADRYGVRLETLGAKFNTRRLGEQANDMADFFDEVRESGGDVGGVLFDMREQISRLVLEAKEAGVVLPESLQQYVAELDRSNNFLDEGRLKFLDMARAALESGDIAEPGLKKLLENIVANKGALGDGIENAGRLKDAFAPFRDLVPAALRPTIDALIDAAAKSEASHGKLAGINTVTFGNITRGLQDVVDKAREAGEAVDGVDGDVSVGGPVDRAPSIEGGAASGVYANRPGLVIFGEGGEEEVGGPRSFFRQIFDDLGLGDRNGPATAAATTSAPVPVSQTHITIQALDAQSFLSFLSNGGGATLVQAIRDNVGQVRTNMNRALAAQT